MAQRKRQTLASDKLFLKDELTSFDMLSMIAGDSSKVQTLDDLKPIKVIRTNVTSFNRAMVLGGLPINTTGVVHGEPGSGKTLLCLSICSSATKLGHAAAYIDAEHALSKKWLKELDINTSGILFKQPDNFEEAFDLVDMWIANFKKGKADGKIPEDRAFIIVVDTIHKLPPKREIDQLKAGKSESQENSKFKKGGDNISKGWGMLRANMISVWLDHLTPLVGKNNIIFIAIAHEKEDKTQDWGQASYHVKGGTALLYEAMFRVRVAKGKGLYEKSGSKNIQVGQEHVFSVEKNKVGYPHEFGRFFIGNGKGSIPCGFDSIREVWTEAKYRKLVDQGGAWFTLPILHNPRFNGEEQVFEYFRTNPVAFNLFIDYVNDNILSPEEYEYTNTGNEDVETNEADSSDSITESTESTDDSTDNG